MLDDHNEKQLQRSQLVSVLIMTVLVVGWSYFFLPTGSTPEEKLEEATATETQATGTETHATGTETHANEAAMPPDSPAEDLEAEPPPASPPVPVRALEPGSLEALLPPKPEVFDPAEDEVVLEGGNLRLVFTRIGARLKRAEVTTNGSTGDLQQLVPDWGTVPDTEAVYPMGLRFAEDEYLGDALDYRRWDVERVDGESALRFTISVPGVVEVVKQFSLSDSPSVVDVAVDLRNLEEGTRRLGLDTGEPAFSLNWGPNVNSGDADKFQKQEVIWRREGNNERTYTSKLEMPRAGEAYSVGAQNPGWGAISSAYWVVSIRPAFEESRGWVKGIPEHFRLGVGGAPRMLLDPDETTRREFKVYMGPRMYATLTTAWADLDSLVGVFSVWGFTPMANFMNWFAISLLHLMNWFYRSVIPNYGLAIIFVTVIVRVAMFPLTIKSMKSMKKMQKLAPEIEKLKEEYGEDQQEMQKRMMEMYRERGVNPVGGCFPMLLQMPVFIAFYRMLSNAFELRHTPFLWIADLSEPDRLIPLPVSIPLPFMGELDGINILPILMGIAMVVSQKLTPTSGPVQNPQQKMIMTLMPIFFSVICYNMASSLNLYILVSTLLGIVQSYITNRADVDVDVSPKKRKKKPGRPRHFYTAAQARKRQAAKEVRRDKRAKKQPRQEQTSPRSGKKRR